MTNPNAAMRMLITYAIIIPVAVILGYLAQDIGNRPDYSNLGILALALAILISPIFIKWHYPIMVFGVGCPAFCFFLMGNPPLWQVVGILGFGIAVLERILNSQRRFISPPVLVWPFLYILAVTVFTAQMTGGIGLHTLGGSLGGGKKYLSIFIGIAIFFALTSRKIPVDKRKLYVALLFLSGMPGFISDAFAVLPAPLNYICLLFPPTDASVAGEGAGMSSRFSALSSTAGGIANYMLVIYGLRGIFDSTKAVRTPLFVLMFLLTLMGGFRNTLVSYMMMMTILFFMEGLHRTRLIIVFVLGIALTGAILVPFSDKLPFSMQRSMSFLPLKWDSEAKLAAEASSEWRYKMWRDLWPKVPGYLLLGKGYGLTTEDFQMMGNATFSGGVSVQMDASNIALAISGDYHSGPLSTLIPFGIWGAIGIVWLQIAAIWVMWRNYKYGDEELKTVNRFLLVMFGIRVFGFYVIFGAYSGDIFEYAKLVGFSIALNQGVCQPSPKPAYNPRIKPLPEAAPQPA